jgi:hypothetical protein
VILLVPMPIPMTAVVVIGGLIIIGALIVAACNWLKKRKKSMAKPHGLLGKAYAPTFVLIGVGGLVIFALLMAL